MARFSNLKKVNQNILTIVFLAAFVFSLRIYTFYFNNLDFGDEYDNFISSWLVLNGRVLYKDFFSHQFPLLTLIGVPLEFISHTKLIYRFFILIATFSCFAYLWTQLRGALRLTIIPFMLFSSFAISLYAGQQFEDGPIWAITIIAAFLLINNSKDKILSKNHSIILGFLTFMVLWSSPTHLLALLAIYIYYLISTSKSLKTNFKANLKNIKVFSATILLLSFIVLIYFLITNSLGDFYKNVFEYNSQHYISRISKEYSGIGLLDFFISSFWETYIFVLLLMREEGAALVSFLKSAKFLITPQGLNSVYIKVIFGDLYNNFFSTDMIIFIFYTIGLVRFLIFKKYLLVILIFILFFLLRLRMETRTHLAPFYLLSYWLMSAGIVYSAKEFWEKNRISINFSIILTLIICTTTFITKHWYSFDQTSFNRFSDPTEKTVNYLKNSNTNDKILVFKGDSARYYYNSGKLPYGYFINFFPWYSSSERLKTRMLTDINSFDENYLIVGKGEWADYSAGLTNSWRSVYFDEINKKFKIVEENGDDYIMDVK